MEKITPEMIEIFDKLLESTEVQSDAYLKCLVILKTEQIPIVSSLAIAMLLIKVTIKVAPDRAAGEWVKTKVLEMLSNQSTEGWNK